MTLAYEYLAALLMKHPQYGKPNEWFAWAQKCKRDEDIGKRMLNATMLYS